MISKRVHQTRQTKLIQSCGWGIFADRFVKNVRVLTFKDVNLEELSGKAYELPKELAVGE
jgi:hypothetical protein